MKEVNKKDLRNFGLILGAIFLIIGIRLFFKLHQVQYIYFIIGSIFVLVSVFCSAILRPLYKVFINIAQLIGWLNTRILLILLFYLIVTPIGLISRLMGKDFLGLRLQKDKSSYWIKRAHKILEPSQYEKQF